MQHNLGCKKWQKHGAEFTRNGLCMYKQPVQCTVFSYLCSVISHLQQDTTSQLITLLTDNYFAFNRLQNFGVSKKKATPKKYTFKKSDKLFIKKGGKGSKTSSTYGNRSPAKRKLELQESLVSVTTTSPPSLVTSPVRDGAGVSTITLGSNSSTESTPTSTTLALPGPSTSTDARQQTIEEAMERIRTRIRTALDNHERLIVTGSSLETNL